MSLAWAIGVFGLQWAAGALLIAGVLKGTMGALRIGGYVVPFIQAGLGQRGLIILLAISAGLSLAAISWLHLAA